MRTTATTALNPSSLGSFLPPMQYSNKKKTFGFLSPQIVDCDKYPCVALQEIQLSESYTNPSLNVKHLGKCNYAIRTNVPSLAKVCMSQRVQLLNIKHKLTGM